MGYFANSTEHDTFAARWCARCVHDDGETGCPVMGLHLEHNYSQHKNATARSMLEALIPRDWATNGKCAMFVETAGDDSRG